MKSLILICLGAALAVLVRAVNEAVTAIAAGDAANHSGY
jgi:hypothetical protein